jgi:hypothetical protein
MEPDDKVFFWLAGEPEIRGIYGRGRLISRPYSKPDWDSHGVDVRYEQRVDPHVSADVIRADPDLADLLILRAPQATNFLLSATEAQALNRLIPER